MSLRIRWIIFLTGGFFLLVDRLLKYAALRNWQEENLLTDWLGWSPWKNYGAIFSLPFSAQMITLLSLPLVILILYFFIRLRHNFSAQSALYFILLGAVSNLFDRLIYCGTIDYLLVFTGIINLSDILIFTGAIWFLYFNYNKKRDGTSG